MGIESNGISVNEVNYRKRDLFRRGLIRYLGWAPEIVVTLRPVLRHTWEALSYKARTVYISAHVLTKSLTGGGVSGGIVAAVDTLVWQGLASVLLPTFFMTRIRYLADHVLYRTTLARHTRGSPWAGVAVGLVAVVLLVDPIDSTVDFFMNKTVRRIYY